jgi:hypothetical protein
MRALLHPLLVSGGIDHYSDLYWSDVGPHHKRASYNLLYLVDVHAAKHGLRSDEDGAPFRASNAFGFRREDRVIEPKEYSTMLAAQQAAREWVVHWLSGTNGAIEWSPTENGVHFVATAAGLQIGSYYHSPKQTARWHRGFRAHFGMTYYREDGVRTPEEAKAEIAETWAEWLRRAREQFLATSEVHL